MKKYFFITFLIAINFLSAAYAENKNKIPDYALDVANTTTQFITVIGTGGSNAIFTMYEKDCEKDWQKVIVTPAYVGKKGFGKTREGDLKTPVGIFHFTKAFGINKNPGCSLGYTQVDETNYWCGDSNSPYYNQFVSTRDYNNFNKKDSEHIIDYALAYKYVLNISYNEDGKPGLGSAIFLHCFTKNHYTGGCVAISEEQMLEVLRRVKSDCKIIIRAN